MRHILQVTRMKEGDAVRWFLLLRVKGLWNLRPVVSHCVSWVHPLQQGTDWVLFDGGGGGGRAEDALCRFNESPQPLPLSQGGVATPHWYSAEEDLSEPLWAWLKGQGFSLHLFRGLMESSRCCALFSIATLFLGAKAENAGCPASLHSMTRGCNVTAVSWCWAEVEFSLKVELSFRNRASGGCSAAGRVMCKTVFQWFLQLQTDLLPYAAAAVLPGAAQVSGCGSSWRPWWGFEAHIRCAYSPQCLLI